MLDALLTINWDIDPTFIESPFEIRYYGILFAAGFGMGFYLLKRMFQHEKINEKWLDPLVLYVMLGTIIGARLGHVFFYGPYFDVFSADGQLLQEGYLSHPINILKIREGGLASHGGAIAITLACWLYSRNISKKSILWIMDRLVVVTALAGVMIRLGNLMNHEIVGIETDVAWAFSFKYSDQGPAPRHAVQLYEAICYLFIFFYLYFAYWKQQAYKYSGRLLGMFLVLIFLARFVMEFWKIPQQELTEEPMFLRMGQILSIPAIAVGLWLWISSKNKLQPEENA